MEDQPASVEESPPAPRPWWRRKRWGLFAVLALGLSLAWLSRKDIADNFIAGQLADRGVPATWRVESVGLGRQVLADLVIGDPARPDFTAKRIEVETANAWGLPGLGRITLVRPRLYGTLRDGKVSFGKLDPLIFTDSKEPPQLPDLDIALVDGRARIDSDFGPIGIKAEGRGRLPQGFAGTLAAVAPKLALEDCAAEGASLYGQVRTEAGKPRFAGPLRLRALDCGGVKVGPSAAEARLALDRQFDGAEGRLSLRGGTMSADALRLASSAGDVRFVWRKQVLTAHYDLTASRVSSPQAALADLSAKGVLRAGNGFARVDVEGDVAGKGLAMGPALDRALADLGRSGQGTLLDPIAAQMRNGLRREGAGSRLSARFILRRADDGTSLVLPQAQVTGGSGAALLALSRVQALLGGAGGPVVSGNFITGGTGLPRISGRMEQLSGGRLVARMAMAEYRAGSARVAVPRLMVAQANGGALGFSGEARLSGDLPGGRAEGLVLPVQGNWSARGGLALWQACVPVRFDSLVLADLRLDRRALTLCPPRGGAIVRTGQGGLRIAAGLPALALSGRLGDTPLRLASGPVGLAWPGNMAARAIDVELGPPGTASRFRISSLAAALGRDVAGTFSGADVSLAAVPLDLRDAAGRWHFAAGRLTLSEGAFRLEDREANDRFQPLTARDATLVLEDSRIVARAMMREPASRREVVSADIAHNLSLASGEARLSVPGIRFDKDLQPDTLSRLALGIIANTEGSVRGEGLVRWNGDRVESQGRFSSDGLDFAAAFGPVKGVSGTVAFTDLLGLVTAPDQRLAIAAINPGIEAANGTLSFELRGNNLLVVNGAQWPFLDGQLRLEPTRMVLGAAEVRHFTLAVEGLDAARFVQHLQLSNLAASGVFDGRLPLVFDENGGRIEGGALVARPPGGNVSYVGELTYKDLSAMGNYAFAALRSVNYRSMRIDMNGALTGEIITRVSFDGLSQGDGASRNFLTKQVAKLPIRFNVNVRAPFFSLFGSFKSLYDPALVADPRMIGLLDRERGVQPPASEKVR